MRRGDGQQAALGEHPGELVEADLGVLEVLEDLEADDEVEGAVVERKLLEVGGLESHCFGQSRPRRVEHGAGTVDPGHLGRVGLGQNGGPISGAAAGVEHPAPLRLARDPRVAGEVLGLDQGLAVLRAIEALGVAFAMAAEILLCRRIAWGLRPCLQRVVHALTLRAEMPSLRELVFVSARGQNLYFDELTEALRYELDAIGVGTTVSVGALPEQRDDAVSVIVGPHEFAALGPSGERLGACGAAENDRRLHRAAWHPLVRARCPRRRARGRGPRHQSPRRHGAAPARRSRRAVAAWFQRVLAAGGRRRPGARSTSASSVAPPRGASATCPPTPGSCWRHRCHLRLGDNSQPNAATAPSFVAGERKLELLARSRVLINLHRDDRPYFEWQRVLEAIHCGAAVVSEHSTGFEPLVPGEHFLPGRPESLHLLSAELLASEPEREALAARALDFIREELPMRAAAERLADSAEQLLGSRRVRLPRLPVRIGPEPPEPPLRSLLQFRGRGGQNREALATLKDTRLEMLELRRRVDELTARAEHGGAAPEIETEAESPAYRPAEPRVDRGRPLLQPVGTPARGAGIGRGSARRRCGAGGRR